MRFRSDTAVSLCVAAQAKYIAFPLIEATLEHMNQYEPSCLALSGDETNSLPHLIFSGTVDSSISPSSTRAISSGVNPYSA